MIYKILFLSFLSFVNVPLSRGMIDDPLASTDPVTAEKRFVNIIYNNKKIDDVGLEVIYAGDLTDPGIIRDLLKMAHEKHHVLFQGILRTRLVELSKTNPTVCLEDKKRYQKISNFMNEYDKKLNEILAECENFPDERPFLPILEEMKENNSHITLHFKDKFINIRNKRRKILYASELKKSGLIAADDNLGVSLTPASTITPTPAIPEKFGSSESKEQTKPQIPSPAQAPSINIIFPENKFRIDKKIIVGAVVLLVLIQRFYSVKNMKKFSHNKTAWLNWSGDNLVKDIWLKYGGSANTDYDDKSAMSFFNDIHYEEKTMRSYIGYAKMAKRLRINRLLGISEQDINQAEQQLKNLKVLENNFIDWIVERKVKLNMQDMRRSAMALL